jgi:large subunit ribosomal protein L30|tara:strand:- start:274 stop:495 length:222 start_codon:yes stop_codon:yes gene_type:complete
MVAGKTQSKRGKKVNSKLKVTQIKSTIGYAKRQAHVVKGLGLRRMGHSVEVVDNPATRGMIHKVRHLVEVVEE